MATHLRLDNDDEEGLFTNKTTMMANFEEWIKMATDNKINSSNSWNFALIDYFYDLNVLKDSENNINFQKASATLDGCVKIYSSRVDSVSNETGKLLSGLAQRKEITKRNVVITENGEQVNGEGNGEGDADNHVAGEDSVQIDPLTGLPISVTTDLARRRVHNRILETTLVDFDTIKLKALDQELNIDPLFKKALVDFDEGGAKSLLLNTLDLDDSLRVVFDASIKEDKQKSISSSEDQQTNDDVQDEIIDKSGSMMDNSVIDKSKSQNLVGDDTKDTTFIVEDEVLALGIDFIKFDQLAISEISPSIQQLRNVVEDISKAKSFVKNVNNKLDNFLTEEEIKDTVPDAFDGIDDNMDYYDDENGAINSNGNLSARRLDMSNIGMDEGEDDDDNDELQDKANDNTTIQPIMEKDLMAYFDDNLNKNWRGREHWKVRSFKKKLLPEVELNDETNPVAAQNSATTDAIAPDGDNNDGDTVTQETSQKKKKKKTVTIDFFNLDDSLEDNVFIQPKKKSSIEMPQRLRINDTHYLLPDDFHFSTEKITKLFIKQRQTMSLFSYTKRTTRTDSSYMRRDTFTSGIGTEQQEDGEGHGPEIADEEFWAETYKRKEEEEEARVNGSNGETTEVVGARLENPFDDGDDNGIDFNQAFDDAEYNDDEQGDNQPIREDYIKKNEDELNGMPQKVNYSRVSKKVDVRRLKNNVWKSVLLLVNEKDADAGIEQQSNEIITLSFKDIAKELVKFYPKELLKDISTSFCFICLLHLSNEHGLTIQNTEKFEDLKVEYNKSTIQLSQ
ncbi:similar to Saccharomyces cerevisiae YBL097W BRN1 Subunit of the condensin complex [Maudiozyma saulgeensis]|uniref:Condensin complex subunit 2 n=1 Tax=Maudiozyma saulgeensis TaxID=1789683 RepID=A0A1X7R7U2_9SACH|nr:similar to Saccharomyces cerevisiae YBL097W BRN1 Subunit of the condensin complex [Kazachstania saulgeensis]